MVFGGGLMVTTDTSVQDSADIVWADVVTYTPSDYYEAGFSAYPQEEAFTPYWTLAKYNQLTNSVLIGGLAIALLLWLLAYKR